MTSILNPPLVKPAMEAMRFITTQYTHGITRLNPALIWTDSGMARMGCIAGWLTALEMTQPDLANQLADEILSRLKYLAGEDKEARPYGDFPTRRCVLSDDGSLHGFSLLWYNLITRERAATIPAQHLCWWSPFQTDNEVRKGIDTEPYAFSYNGGLLWHGPGDNSFAVNLADAASGGRRYYWGTHT